MGFIGKLFGSKPSLEKMRSALEQGSYADALHLGEDLLAGGDETSELAESLIAASDGLARMNYDEGIRSQQAGDTQLAVEHLQLALAQARSVALIREIDLALAHDPTSVQLRPEDQPQPVLSKGASCAGCSPASVSAEVSTDELPDLQSQIELIIASYPAEMQQAYLSRSKPFMQAFMLVHCGEDLQALPLWEEVPREERDEIYLFELGCLYARQGEAGKGVAMLRQALELSPGNGLMIDALLSLLVDQGDQSAASKFLQAQIDTGANPAFCYARLCELQATSQETSAAYESANKALAGGYAEPDFLVLAASLFEAVGRVEDAEQMLAGLPGGGCGGGINLPLAELWLRQNRELARVLDAFNDACRQEPENPRWQLRVAQTYLARKWRKQGLDLLQRVVGDPRLEEGLRLEAERLLAEV